MITNAGTFHWLHVILASFKFVFKLTKQKLKVMLKLACIQMQTNNIKLSYNYTFCHLHAVTWHHAKIIHSVKLETNNTRLFESGCFQQRIYNFPP
jgi:hypothetical protein